MPTVEQFYEGMSQEQRSREFLLRRESLFRHLTENHPELQVSKVDFRGWSGVDGLALVVEVHNEKARTWIKENVPEWERVSVVPYLPYDLLELTMIGHRARWIVDMLQSTDPKTRFRAIDELKKWIGDK
jgi:hypothetical protein